MKLKKDLQKTAADLLRYPVVLAAVAMTVAMGTALYFLSPAISKSHAATTIPGDLNGDGRVDIFDLSILLANFGKSIIPTPTPTGSPGPTPPPPTPSPTPPPSGSSAVNAAPTGPSAPASGWHVAFADGFGAPLVDQSSGSSTTNDAFWLFNGGVAGNRPGFNANEVEVFNSSKISKQADGLHLIATYTPNVASGKNYTTGMVTTSPNTSLTGFEMMLGGGETWGVEAVTKMAPGYDGGKQSGGNDEGWWTDTIGWKDEFDFFEHWGWSNVPSTTGDVWIYSTSPLHNTSITSNLSTFCRCDPSAAFHRYTTLINPNNTFSFYMDGKLVGTHAAPPSFQKMWMRLLLSYGLRAPSPNPNPIPGFQSGSRDWVIRSVAIYQDNAHADKDIQKGGIAPGTTIVP